MYNNRYTYSSVKEYNTKLRNIHNYNLFLKSQQQQQQNKISSNIVDIKTIHNELSKIKKPVENINIPTEEIHNKIKVVLTALHTMNKSDRIKYLQNLKVIHKIGTINNHSNVIHLLENYIVKKSLKHNKLGYILFNNEIKALLRLYKYDNFPKILGWDTQTLTIYMTYCGSEINNRNIPENYIHQFHIIKDIFLKEGLSNNDILERNICVLGEKIYVIDFGLCNNLEINKVIHDLYTKLNKIYAEKKKIEYLEQLKIKHYSPN